MNKTANDDPELLSRIFQQTRVIDELPLERFERELRAFAARYGVLGCGPGHRERDSEFERGLHALIGGLTERAATQEAYPISAEYLAQAFCGYPAPRQLTAEAVDVHTSAPRADRSAELGVNRQPVRRRLLDEVLDRAAEHAFLMLTGEGGHGKSVLGWQAVQAAFGGGVGDHPVPAAFLPSREVAPSIFARVVGEWANRPPDRRAESTEASIARLCAANPEAHPVFCLCLDGLDEVSQDDARAREIEAVVRWFWRQEEELRRRRLFASDIVRPDATLVVTCRREAEVIETWLRGTLSSRLRENPPDTIRVPVFSPDEVIEAARLIMPSQLLRIEGAFAAETITGLDELATTPRMSPTSRSGAAPQGIDPQIRAVLTHPVIWYAISRMGDDHAAAMLDGKPKALAVLARHVIEWFVDRVAKRRSMEREEITDILQAVAARTETTPGVELPLAIWGGCALQAGSGAATGKTLYREALSAGIIEQADAARRWSWRHPFVAHYLAGAAQEEGWYDD